MVAATSAVRSEIGSSLLACRSNGPRVTTQLASVLARQGRAQAGETRLHAMIDAFDTKNGIVDLAAARKVLDTLLK